MEFFRERGHVVIPSASLVPQNDPTTLFTGSGMQPLVPYLLGQKHPSGTRLTNSQKSFRAVDIPEVGDNRHTTFFEMLGNWSLGDYFKAEQLPWIFEFLTDVLKLDPARLYVTVFAGDAARNIPRDEESVAIWKKLFAMKGIEAKDVELLTESQGSERGMQGGRIFYYGAEKNWWSRAGVPKAMPAGEPGGPDSEVFYEFAEIAHDPKFGTQCHPNCDCGRFLEIGNSVFMEYKKLPDGSFEKLAQRNVDFGGGLERMSMAAANNADIFEVNHKPILAMLEEASQKKYEGDLRYAFRVIADHMKAAVFLVADGVYPSKTERGYFVRRLIRRAVRYADVLGIAPGMFSTVVAPIIAMYEDAYPELLKQKESIETIINAEELQFRATLAQGMREFEKLAEKKAISGSEAFTLFATYGFPLELTLDLAKERGIPVDQSGFTEEMEKHQDISRAGVTQKFKGGLADTSEKTTRLHTAHHLLLKALQVVLGPSVKQRGSNITQERLRLDFAWGEKLTPEQISEVEKLMNQKIAEDLPVLRTEMAREDAEQLHAEHEFGQKYPDRVSVYSIGPKEATQEMPQFAEAFSIEFCGGPHVVHTGEIGKFKISKEEAIAAGIRRIRAVVE